VSEGGAITLQWDGASLSLITVMPAPAHEAHIVGRAGSKVHVHFRCPTRSSIKVEVDVEIE
jgi:hypothetical protein